jgi:hypothetical protein
MKCDSQASLLARTLASPCLGREPKARVATIQLPSFVSKCTFSLIKNDWLVYLKHLKISFCNSVYSPSIQTSAFVGVGLLALSIGKRLCVYAGFGLGDKILAHSLANVEMTIVHRMKFFIWM